MLMHIFKTNESVKHNPQIHVIKLLEYLCNFDCQKKSNEKLDVTLLFPDISIKM